MKARTSTPDDWLYALLAGAFGLFMAFVAGPAQDGVARFLVGLLIGLSAVAILAGVYAYLRDHPLHHR